MIEESTLPQIVDLDRDAIRRFLTHHHFGHLGVCRRDRPYVVPLTFIYDAPHIYFFTTEGLKTEMIDANPTACLQVEDIRSAFDWESVIVTGTAVRLTESEAVEHGMKRIEAIDPGLAPAWSIRWL